MTIYNRHDFQAFSSFCRADVRTSALGRCKGRVDEALLFIEHATRAMFVGNQQASCRMLPEHAALGERLNRSPEGARALVKRLRLPRQKANDGKTLVTVDLTEIEHRPLPARSAPDHHSAAKTMQARIEALETELAKVEAVAANHRADFERERGRSDKLLSEVLRATHDLIGANEVAARAESELVVVRIQAEGERTAAMRAEADLAAIRARASWRRRLTG